MLGKGLPDLLKQSFFHGKISDPPQFDREELSLIIAARGPAFPVQGNRNDEIAVKAFRQRSVQQTGQGTIQTDPLLKFELLNSGLQTSAIKAGGIHCRKGGLGAPATAAQVRNCRHAGKRLQA